MKAFFSALIVTFLFLFAAPTAYANGESTADCRNGAICDCIKKGTCGHVRAPANCVVKIFAPTFGGKVALDIRDESGKSRFPDGPRSKTVGPGIVSFGVGCQYLDQPTDLVYLCVEGADKSLNFVSIRYRQKGDFDAVPATKRLELCLKGPECKRFVEGPPPKL